MAKTFSENMISKLENSADPLSIDMFTKLLVRTFHWPNEEHELEEFVAGIPGLYGSDASATQDNGDERRNIRHVLAVLPGPTGFHAPLPWCIIRLSQQAIASNLSIQQRRTPAFLRALYYIPGAIRDVLAPYAAGDHYYLKLLPLLNSTESLGIIDELWDAPNEDVALSVRCAAAMVAAFMITPPRHTLGTVQTPFVGFIGDNETGMQFLAQRFRVGPDADAGIAPNYQLRGDSARLQNITRFLADIKDTLQFGNTQWINDVESIRRDRRALFDARHTEEYRDGRSMFDQQGNRALPTFVAAAQQDLITLTLEALARDPVANAGTSQREAFRDVSMRIGQVVTTQARRHTQAHTFVLEALAFRQVQAVDSIEMVRRPLEPVLLSLSLPQSTEIPTPQPDDASPFQMPVSSPAPVEMVSTNDTLGPAGVGTTHRRQPPPTQTPLLMSQCSTPSSAGLAASVAELGNSLMWGAQATVAE